MSAVIVFAMPMHAGLLMALHKLWVQENAFHSKAESASNFAMPLGQCLGCACTRCKTAELNKS